MNRLVFVLAFCSTIQQSSQPIWKESAHLPVLEVSQPVDQHIEINSIRRIKIILVIESFLRLLRV